MKKDPNMEGRWSQVLTPQEDGSFSHHFQRLIEPGGSGVYIIMMCKSSDFKVDDQVSKGLPNHEALSKPTKQTPLRRANSRKWWRQIEATGLFPFWWRIPLSGENIHWINIRSRCLLCFYDFPILGWEVLSKNAELIMFQLSLPIFSQ